MNKFTALNETEIKNELMKIFDNASKKIVYENAEIYFVTHEQIEIVKLLQVSAKKIVFNKKFNDPFFQFAKVLNRDYPAIAYKTFKKHKYKNVTDPEKVKKRIEREFEISVKEMKRFNKNLLLENADEIDDNFRNKIAEEEKTKIERAEYLKNHLINNFDFLDIRITTFKEYEEYPHIKFLDSIGEETRDYLRTEVPNILFAHKNIFILEPGYRKDANHIKFVLEAEHAFGEIFYKEKEKTNE